MSLRIGAELGADLTLSPDVCIVGSGAGGGVLAEGLCARGLEVVMLEEGGAFSARDFDLREDHALERLYQDGGGRATRDLSIAILQGRAVGGGTLVNLTSCLRVPDRVLGHWRDVHGVAGLTPEALRPHFEAVEERLSIAPWPRDYLNRNNQVLWDGCEALGFNPEPMPRNVKRCLNLGFCGLGCAADAKQSMYRTYLADALERGLTLLADCRAERIEQVGRSAAAVHAVVLDRATRRPTGVKVIVRPRVVVVACGAINSPALLLRSGIDSHGRTGRGTWLHPTVISVARFAERVDAFYGAPQTAHSRHFAERGPGRIGWFMEAAPLQPAFASQVIGGFGAAHRDAMATLPYLSALMCLSIDGLMPDEVGGTVSLSPEGQPQLDYAFSPALSEAFREASRAAARVQLAAGALEVFTAHTEPLHLRAERDLALFDRARWGPSELAVTSAHCMGGCAMGADPRRSVVDSTLRHHTVDNLYVVDGSVFPTGLGVNPSETIYALARWAAGSIAAAV